ncbi:MAG: cupin domain-containing protein [Oscillospiraceae bacterium]
MKEEIEQKTKQIAQRIKNLRYTAGLSIEQMSMVTGVTIEQYMKYEQGRQDFPLSFLLQTAHSFGLDITQIVTGENPTSNQYTVVRSGAGMSIERREGLNYRHLAYLMQNRSFEPFIVKAIYNKNEEETDISVSTHKGQELDYVLSGSLKVCLENETIVLHKGDCMMYDSGKPHGMIATEENDCEFLAIVIAEQKQGEYAVPKPAMPIIEDKPIQTPPTVKWSWKGR